MTNRIEEIKERLAKATPGPWTARKALLVDDYAIVVDGNCVMAECFTDIRGKLEGSEEGRTNATFIANSPSDIQFLLDEWFENKETMTALEHIITEQSNEVEKLKGIINEDVTNNRAIGKDTRALRIMLEAGEYNENDPVMTNEEWDRRMKEDE